MTKNYLFIHFRIIQISLSIALLSVSSTIAASSMFISNLSEVQMTSEEGDILTIRKYGNQLRVLLTIDGKVYSSGSYKIPVRPILHNTVNIMFEPHELENGSFEIRKIAAFGLLIDNKDGKDPSEVHYRLVLSPSVGFSSISTFDKTGNTLSHIDFK